MTGLGKWPYGCTRPIPNTCTGRFRIDYQGNSLGPSSPSGPATPRLDAPEEISYTGRRVTDPALESPDTIRHPQRLSSTEFWRPLRGAKTLNSLGGRRRSKPMYSILDIDLDYFNLAKDPFRALRHLLHWASRPVDFVVERHSHAFQRWKRRFRAGSIPAPSHILHVDEHHDMMDERANTNIGNVMYQAMRTWPRCKVHWLIQQPIDSPAMWLTDATWKSLRRRFSRGPIIPPDWPRPDIVSVCTSPAFLPSTLRQGLLEVVQMFRGANSEGRTAEPPHAQRISSRFPCAGR